MFYTHLLAAALPSSPNKAGDWMLIIPAGKFQARDGRSFNSGDMKSMDAIVERTMARNSATELMVDYDHQGHAVAKGDGGTAKAAGWIKELEVRANGIWALVQWTEAARSSIKSEEYRYLSPLFTRQKSGDIDLILNVALVNMPAIDLEAIAAAADLNSQPKETEMNFLEKLAAKLGLDKGASEEAIMTAIDKLKSANTDKAEALTAEALKPIALAAGLDEGVSSETLVSTVEKLTASKDKVIVALTSDLSVVTEKLNTIIESTTNDAAVTFVDGAIKKGHVGVKANRDYFVGQHKVDALATEKVIEGFPILSDTNTSIVPPTVDGKVTALTASQEEAATALGVDHKDYLEMLEAEQA